MTDFIIIGNTNAITYKEVFPLIKEGKVRLGYKPFGGEMYFDITDEYKKEIVKEKKEGSGWKEIDGEICGRVANACWFVTFPVEKRPLTLTSTYDPDNYSRYDNYDAINVDKVKDIPYDYDGVMGVPITVLTYDLENVEIMDARDYAFNDKQRNKTTGLVKDADSSIEGKPTYARILIRRKRL